MEDKGRRISRQKVERGGRGDGGGGEGLGWARWSFVKGWGTRVPWRVVEHGFDAFDLSYTRTVGEGAMRGGRTCQVPAP